MSIFKEMVGKISDTVWRTVRLDSSTHAMETITYPHHEIHGGSMHHAYVNSSEVDFDNGDELWIAFTTPAALKECHMEITVNVTGAAGFMFLRGPTLAVDSGSVRVSNNHNMVKDTAASIISNNTVPVVGSYNYNEEAAGSITGGSVVDERILGSGKNKVSGYDRSAEWILAPSTLYTFAIEAHADNIRASLILDWYEHTPKG